ncbi:hypothetical protein ABZ897_52885 [Nonomuraea sp. NPDC046802]|uniref:hypothetical protein n=1 Tax=Nonomuraea sp. NPDC046802 TaxID=3154919 RepID=UPI0033C2C3FD
MYAAIDDVFVKVVPTSSPVAELHRRERWAARNLPKGAPVPRLVWVLDEVRGWDVSAFELINDHARNAVLRPDSGDLPLVMDTLARLSGAAFVGRGRPVTDYVKGLWAKGRHLLGPDTELDARDLYEAALERFDIEKLREDDTLLHCRLNHRKLLIKHGFVFVVGWSEAACGLPWIDAALLAPLLVSEGHSAEQAGALLSALPAWREADAVLVAGLTALWTLSHLFEAYNGPEQRRESELRLAASGREWLAYRLSKL